LPGLEYLITKVRAVENMLKNFGTEYSNPILFVSKILPLFGMGVWDNGQWVIVSELISS